MSGAIRVEHIRDGSTISEQIELKGMIRLEQSGVKASGGKTRQIRAEQEHHGEIEEPCKNRKEKYGEKIIAESDKNSVEQSRARSAVQNNAEQGDDPIGEGRQKMVVKYTVQWKIMRWGPQQIYWRITIEVRWRCRIIRMSDKVSGEDRGGQAWRRRCGTTGMDTVAEDI